jgi:hypothetical protein
VEISDETIAWRPSPKPAQAAGTLKIHTARLRSELWSRRSGLARWLIPGWLETAVDVDKAREIVMDLQRKHPLIGLTEDQEKKY